jgi:arginine N-succinyltransferase
LELQRIHDGPTEIGSLFLRRKYRGGGRGRWLSLSRFALIAMMRHRFADRVIAEMRGRANADGSVPFWDAVPGRFIPTEFAIADAMSTVSKQFIEEMMPQYPIYLDLLPPEIRAGIGTVHWETAPALKMLLSEGFQETDLVDIFDAGPMISCETSAIKAVRRCREMTVAEVVDELPEDATMILCSQAAGFTSVMTPVRTTDDRLMIGRRAAEALLVDVGSHCVVLPLHPS